jgi:2-octaprenyl-6-methoxyphenol hydroxylase
VTLPVATAPRRCDVLIVGGGAVGSALACTLAELPLDVVLVEAHEVRDLEQPSFDQRVTALANGSQQILAGLGLWDALRGYAEPIRSIHVSERGRFGAARIEAAEEGVPALGYTVENQQLGRALWQRLATAPRVQTLAPAKVVELRTDAVSAVATVEQHGHRFEIEAALVVAADGARSSIRAKLGATADEHDYRQRAVIFNCSTESPPAGRAFERFTSRGPIAMLPLRGGRAAVIWTLPIDDAERVAALPAEEFRAEFQAAFGQRLGRVLKVGERIVHPLWRTVSGPVTAPRAVLIGDAALKLHPVAGQGLNLALRDIATLAEVVADARAADAAADVGAAELLDGYRAWRAGDQRRVAAFTHGLIQLFGDGTPGFAAGRGLGLFAFDLLPGAKAALARQTMGRAGRLPRLARGLRLVR